MPIQFQKKDPRATIVTKFGDIAIRFYPDDAPRHVENFVNLAKMGFFDGTTFHRVVPDFLIQGGDPLSKHPDRSLHGTGGPGYFLPPEPNDRPHKRGAVSMAKMPRESNSTRDFDTTARNSLSASGRTADWIGAIPYSEKSFGESTSSTRSPPPHAIRLTTLWSPSP
jgi:cyclophilin family peptidyl-prolyl cis-trans isomerase